MPRSELTKKFQIAEGMVEYVRENLDEVEYNLFLDMIAPLPEPEPQPAKKSQKKAGRRSSSKSPRASGMAAQLNRSLAQQRAVTTTKDDDYDGGDEQRCAVLRGDLGGTVCGMRPDHNVHHLQSSRGFHPFVPSTTVPPAPTRSPANGGAGSSTQNSEASVVNAGAATGGSND